jgi:hypothetical protein
MDEGVIRMSLTQTQPRDAHPAERAFGFGLVFAGIRCILQYAIFPFVLPLVGISGEVGVQISLAINVVAIVSILFSIRRLWAVRYKHRVAYSVVAVTALIILSAFIVLDVQTLV